VGAQGIRARSGGLRRRRRIPALTDAGRGVDAQLASVGRRFLAYGLFGWALEVGFTGATDCLKLRDRRLRGHSYLWMLPIYGGGGLLLESVRGRLSSRRVPRWARSLAYMLGIYCAEFGTAALLDRAIGEVPWRYSSGINLRGYVRLDYAPFWYICGWLFEDLEAQLRKLNRPARRTWRPPAAEAHASERGAGAALPRATAASPSPAR
jgi:hypothetical protein